MFFSVTVFELSLNMSEVVDFATPMITMVTSKAV